MTNFAAVFARADEGWTGADADLTEVMTIEDIADLMREAAVEVSADTVVLLMADAGWFAIVRISGEGDPRVFLSDSGVATSATADRLAALLYGHAGKAGRVAEAPPGTAAGDLELLGDLGVDPATLAELCERETGEQALAAVADRVGIRDAYERLR